MRPTVFAIFDLNGFKSYNDTFGHPSGDALLVRFAARLSGAAGPHGQAFRMGGDEFCILVPTGGEGLDEVVKLGIAALTEDGDGFHVGAEFGAVVLPDEAADPTAALRLADERLYAHKHRLYKAEEPSHEILLRALTEREPGMREHLLDVAQLSFSLGEELGLSGHTLEQLRLAAELHDIGKVAIPDAVLKKPGALTDQEWRFVRQHTLDRAADPRRCARDARGRRHRACDARALGRRRVRRRARPDLDPARRPDHRRLRRVRGDDLRPALPPRDQPRPRSPSCGGAQARSSTPTSSRRSAVSAKGRRLRSA